MCGRLRILAIDDDKDHLVVLKAILQRGLPGAEIITAQGGEQGLARAREAPPDLILLDLVMPGAGGYEICRLLKAEHRLKNVPTLFITAAGIGAKDQSNARASGAEGMLFKPFEKEELLERICQMAKRKIVGRERLRVSERGGAPDAGRLRSEI